MENARRRRIKLGSQLAHGGDMLARLLLASCFAACFACASTPSPEGSPPGSSPADAVDASVARIHIDYVFLCCSTCSPPYLPVDYDRQTRLMSWPDCDDGGIGSTGAPEGGVPAVSRVLSASEAQQLEGLLKTVTYTQQRACGGEDGEEYYMTTYDDAGHVIRKYSAENINCYGYPAAPRIEDVYALLSTFRG